MMKNELYEINSGIQAKLPQRSPRFSRSFTDLFSSDWLIASRRLICCNAADDVLEVSDFNATIAWALGIDPAFEEKSVSGRPFTLANRGEARKELFA